MRGTLKQSRRTRGGMLANQNATDRESDIAEKPAISRTEDPRFWGSNISRYRGYISCTAVARGRPRAGAVWMVRVPDRGECAGGVAPHWAV